MTQQTMERNSYSVDDLDFTLQTNPSESTSPNEEKMTIRYDINTSESFCELDLLDFEPILYADPSFTEFLNNLKTVDEYNLPSPVMDGMSEFLSDDSEISRSTEPDEMITSIQSADEQVTINRSTGPSLTVIRSSTRKLPGNQQSDQSISLSASVAVTMPTPHKLQLVYPLESTYRARYKSDYFPQNGHVRRPRYVADSEGNHHITLQMPAKYPRDYQSEHVRVALITTSVNGNQHYYSPYKFQVNHDDVKVPDQNPIYLPVQIQPGTSDTMRLHLVLIKSKSDQLYDAQPLQPFTDAIGTVQNIINKEKLTPKDLINRYQLDRSHLAFTLCTKLSNGSYDLHHETTVISSVITEASSKLPAVSTKPAEPTTNNAGKRISCPNCQHCFSLRDVDATEVSIKRKGKSSTARTTTKTATSKRTIKKKKLA